MKTGMRTKGVDRVTFLACALVAAAAASCDLPMNTADEALNSSGSQAGSNAGTASSSSQELAMASVPAQSVNLASSVTVPVSIQSQNGFSGAVSLSIDSRILAANDPMSTVSVLVSPSIINIPAGGSGEAMVTITTMSSSPDLSSSVNLIATSSAGSVATSIPLQITAVYEVDILGAKGASENWSLPAGSTVYFTQHKNGIKVNFVNKYSAQASGTVRIHSSATAFQHQGSEGLGLPGQSTAPSATQNGNATFGESVTAGDAYSVTVLSQSSMLTDSVYDHNNENPAVASRKLVFNAYSAPPVIGNSGNPNASYAYIKTNVITPMCASCHVTQQLGGVDLSSYASLMGYVQAGSAQGSSFYTAIAPGGSMPQGSPGSVNATLVKDVQDWIDDGASDN